MKQFIKGYPSARSLRQIAEENDEKIETKMVEMINTDRSMQN